MLRHDHPRDREVHRLDEHAVSHGELVAAQAASGWRQNLEAAQVSHGLVTPHLLRGPTAGRAAQLSVVLAVVPLKEEPPIRVLAALLTGLRVVLVV
jgi:hypothetical protein